MALFLPSPIHPFCLLFPYSPSQKMSCVRFANLFRRSDFRRVCVGMMQAMRWMGHSTLKNVPVRVSPPLHRPLVPVLPSAPLVANRNTTMGQFFGSYSISSTVTLRCGLAMPRFGLGTWLSKGDHTNGKGEAYNACKIALANNYPLIDTAQMYQNEKDVGTALRESTFEAKDIFLVTKLARKKQQPLSPFFSHRRVPPPSLPISSLLIPSLLFSSHLF